MRVRCRAVADPYSSAIGALELESTPEGLWLSYESIASYREGYAPGVPAQRSEHRVAWHRVRATRLRAELLRLEVQEPLTPFKHFMLRDFALAEPQAWSARGEFVSPQVVLTQFCHELSLGLGSPVPHEVPLRSRPGLERGPQARSLPPAGVALLILVCSAVLAAMMLSEPPAAPASLPAPETSLYGPSAPPPAPPPSPAPPAPALAEPASGLERADYPALPAPRLGGGCSCIRHESVLWQEPPPRLTALVTQVQRRSHGAHQHLELELAVVNNGQRELPGLNLGVQISTTQAERGNPDEVPVERSQYFPGPIAPGTQLSWRASARGDRFRLHLPDLGNLDEDGIDAAPVAAFAELAAGPPGLVRLHAATMLAFLGDANARDALLRAREGLAAVELAHVERALEATGSLHVCQLVVSRVGRATRAQSCLYNAADVTQSNFELKIRSVQVEQASHSQPFARIRTLAEERLDWSGSLPPRRGRRLDLAIDLTRAGSSPDQRIELVALAKARRQ